MVTKKKPPWNISHRGFLELKAVRQSHQVWGHRRGDASWNERLCDWEKVFRCGQKWFARMRRMEDMWLLWSNGFTVCWISQKRWHLELIAALMTFNVTPVQFPALRSAQGFGGWLAVKVFFLHWMVTHGEGIIGRSRDHMCTMQVNQSGPT